MPSLTDIHLRRYYNFISSRKNRNIKNNVYTETHHIVPRSMNGLDEDSNLINLTAREHFIAHLILWKAFGGPMTYAFWRMTHSKQNGKKELLTSRQFENLKIQLSELLKIKGKKNKNRIWIFNSNTKDLKFINQNELNSYLEKGYLQGVSPQMKEKRKNRIILDETKFKLSQVNKGKKHTKETKQKISNSKKGKYFSETHKNNISKSKKGSISFKKNKNYSDIYGDKKSLEIKKLLSIQHADFSGEKNPFFGKTHTKETTDRIWNTIRTKYSKEEIRLKSITTKNRIR